MLYLKIMTRVSCLCLMPLCGSYLECILILSCPKYFTFLLMNLTKAYSVTCLSTISQEYFFFKNHSLTDGCPSTQGCSLISSRIYLWFCPNILFLPPWSFVLLGIQKCSCFTALPLSLCSSFKIL